MATKPIVIAHRGASGYRPEHTLAAYELAIDQGADFIEPDLVATKDGILVVRHENAIAVVDPIQESTTDVMERPEFASRRATKVIDGVSITGWFTEDLTLAELKTLRARERMPTLRPQNASYVEYEIATFEEVVDLASRRNVGIYPETKHPTYFRSLGLPLEEPLLKALHGFPGSVVIQSFEEVNLRMLRNMTTFPLVQLLSEGEPWAQMATAAGLERIATYADGVGPHKNYIIPKDASGALAAPTRFVEDAHAAGLVVHAWTFRSENFFLPRPFRRGADADLGDFASEYARFFGAGVDGVFTDYPDHAISVRG